MVTQILWVENGSLHPVYSICMVSWPGSEVMKNRGRCRLKATTLIHSSGEAPPQHQLAGNASIPHAPKWHGALPLFSLTQWPTRMMTSQEVILAFVLRGSNGLLRNWARTTTLSQFPRLNSGWIYSCHHCPQSLGHMSNSSISWSSWKMSWTVQERTAPCLKHSQNETISCPCWKSLVSLQSVTRDGAPWLEI